MFRLAIVLPLIVAAPESEVKPAVDVVVESTLPTSGLHVRQQAFDGDPGTAYEAARPPRKGDSVTLRFDEPVLVRSAEIRARGLDGGRIEGSEDGKAFAGLGAFRGEVARIEPEATLRAIRVVPAADANGLIAIQEFAVDSDPGLRRFRFPVEFVVDRVDDPKMKNWTEAVAKRCERTYDVVAAALHDDDGRPPRIVRISLDAAADAPASTSGCRITGSTNWFRRHPDDFGSIVHESARVVQDYRGRGNPDWLVQGVAAYVRFIVFEADADAVADDDDQAPRDRVHRNTAKFLDYIVKNYDSAFVRKLNKAIREREYTEDLFKASTGKTVDELGREWKAALASLKG